MERSYNELMLNATMNNYALFIIQFPGATKEAFETISKCYKHFYKKCGNVEKAFQKTCQLCK